MSLRSLMLTSSVRLAVVSMLTSSADSRRVPAYYTTMAYSTNAGSWRAPSVRMCKAEGEAQSSKVEIATEIKLVNYQVQ